MGRVDPRALAIGLAGLASLLPCTASAQDAPGTPVDGPQDFALVDMSRFPSEGELAVQRGVAEGRQRLLLAPNTTYRLIKLDRASLRVGYCEFQTGPSGSRFTIPAVALRAAGSQIDTDHDQICDLGEFVLATDPNDPDTDGDGILDGAQARAGTATAPLLRTGLIASVQLPGRAQDVCGHDDLVAVALGDAGVAIASVFTRLNPVVIGLVRTSGEALRVANSGHFVAVAVKGGPGAPGDGTGGLSVIDISDPPATPIVHHVPSTLLGGEPSSVAAVAGLAFVGLSTGSLAVVDLASGSLLAIVPVGPLPIVDVTIAGDAIYALDLDRIYTLALQPGHLLVSSSVLSPHPNRPNLRVFAGGSLLYTAHGGGANSFSITDPLLPVLIKAGDTPQRGWEQVVLNGSGLALGAVGAAIGGDDVNLYDARNPTATDVLLAHFVTPRAARAITLFDGLCYVADDDGGLHVINYIAQDRLGVAPTIALSASIASQAVSGTAEEGALLRISATCQDDVQVRNCELFVDGVSVETDGNFPFEFYRVLPRRTERTQITVRVRVSDTGGNSRFSDPLVLTISPDATAPAIVRVSPPQDGALGQAGVVAVFFSESIDAGTLVPANFRLTAAGPDRLLGTSDDVPITGALEFRDPVKGAFFTPPTALAPGHYRVAVQNLADQGGNVVPPKTWDFTVYGSGGPDQDGDGLPDELERLLGLSPTDADTDHDGIPDGLEDADGDGVPNSVEVVLGMDLRSTDSDADGIPDALEDQDNDRLADWQEVVRHTNVFAHDTDGDSFTDNDEVLRGSNPLDPSSVPLRALTTATTARNLAAPDFKLGRGFVVVTIDNAAPPEAVLGKTQAPPTSVQNQSP